MPFALSEDEALIEKTVREFARAQIGLEKAADADRHDRFPADDLAAAAGLGLAALAAPAAAGGAGGTAYALALHQVAQVCPNTAAVLAGHASAVRLVAGTSLEATLLPRLAAGELGAVLATEEAGGSDHSAFGTVARPDGDGWRISGQKAWGLGVAEAKHFLVAAQVPKAGPTLFWVEAGAPGVTLSRNEALLGLRAAGIRSVYLANVRVGPGHLAGETGQGKARLDAAGSWLRVGAAACLLGAAAGAAEAAARFAESRVQFGEPIGTYQAVSDAVTAMDVQLTAGRSLLLEAAARLDAPDAALWSARAKAYAAETAVAMTRQAIRVQGGTGFMREGGTERFARDVRALQFLGETVHMQRDLLKRELMPAITFPATP